MVTCKCNWEDLLKSDLYWQLKIITLNLFNISIKKSTSLIYSAAWGIKISKTFLTLQKNNSLRIQENSKNLPDDIIFKILKFSMNPTPSLQNFSVYV